MYVHAPIPVVRDRLCVISSIDDNAPICTEIGSLRLQVIHFTPSPSPPKKGVVPNSRVSSQGASAAVLLTALASIPLQKRTTTLFFDVQI